MSTGDGTPDYPEKADLLTNAAHPITTRPRHLSSRAPKTPSKGIYPKQLFFPRPMNPHATFIFASPRTQTDDPQKSPRHPKEILDSLLAQTKRKEKATTACAIRGTALGPSSKVSGPPPPPSSQKRETKPLPAQPSPAQRPQPMHVCVVVNILSLPSSARPLRQPPHKQIVPVVTRPYPL